MHDNSMETHVTKRKTKLLSSFLVVIFMHIIFGNAEKRNSFKVNARWSEERVCDFFFIFMYSIFSFLIFIASSLTLWFWCVGYSWSGSTRGTKNLSSRFGLTDKKLAVSEHSRLWFFSICFGGLRRQTREEDFHVLMGISKAQPF